MNTIKLNTLGDKVIVRKAAENGGNAGGDTGGSGGGNIFYANDSTFPFPGALSAFSLLSSVAKVRGSNGLIIGPSLYAAEGAGNDSTILAAGFDPNQRIYSEENNFSTIREFFEYEGMPLDELTGISEEEFYNTTV